MVKIMTRRLHDQYFTPASACEVLKAHWAGWKGHNRYGSILIDPCCGDGAFQRAFPDGPWKTIDIDPSMNPDYVFDMAEQKSWAILKKHHSIGAPLGFIWSECVIMNPPFKYAMSFVQNAVDWFGQTKTFIDETGEHQPITKYGSVAALLRLSFLEPTRERGPWLAANPPDLVIVLPRISFTGDGKTDSVTCAWMIWDKTIKKKGVIVSPRP
jgi:hypothetical protein